MGLREHDDMTTPSTPPRWRFLNVLRIADRATGLLYLWRLYIVETPWFGVMLHRIVRPDHDEELHDHPWSFLSLVLWGGYMEAVESKDFVPGEHVRAVHPWRRIRWASFHRAEDAHRIALLKNGRPAWTLVFTGPRRREWGFHVPDYGWVDWRTFLDFRGMERALAASRAAEDFEEFTKP